MQPPELLPASIFPAVHLSRRQSQTLDRILQGDSEKQIARCFRVSQNTIHAYIRWIYVAYDVNSRSELMARFIPDSFRAAVVASPEQMSRIRSMAKMRHGPDDHDMKPKRSIATEKKPRRPKLSNRPTQYVGVDDLRSILKLGLGLHASGQTPECLHQALEGLSRLAGASAWAAAVLPLKAPGGVSSPVVLAGGADSHAAQMLTTQIATDYRVRRTPMGRLITSRHTGGRVLAVLVGSRTIYSILCPELAQGEKPERTLIVIVRRDDAAKFAERERRLVELFHSQSAWLLLELAPSMKLPPLLPTTAQG